MSDDILIEELRALGRSADVPPVPADLTTAVLERIAAPATRHTFADKVRTKWRALLALFALLIAGALLAPPVRAAVADWFDIGGVRAQSVESGPTSAPPPPSVEGQLSLPEAAQRAGIEPVTPTALGDPSRVEASPGLVAMGWAGGIRLEQFTEQLSPTYIKKYYAALEPVPSIDGYWFSTPHELVLEDSRGVERRVRVAGPTLVWLYGGLTFRLEGVDKARAIEIAQSTTG